MHFPTWVDLKGQDSVPETVHHVVCYIDPTSDTSWHSLPRKVKVREGEREGQTFSDLRLQPIFVDYRLMVFILNLI